MLFKEYYDIIIKEYLDNLVIVFIKNRLAARIVLIKGLLIQGATVLILGIFFITYYYV